MKEECNHYWIEKFQHGYYTTRYFECIFCNTPVIEKAPNKLMNFREEAPTRAWGSIFKARNAK